MPARRRSASRRWLAMEIKLSLHGALSRYRPPEVAGYSAFLLEVPDGATVAAVVERLGIPRSWLRAVFVNDQACPIDWKLGHGDRVSLFPPAGGGA